MLPTANSQQPIANSQQPTAKMRTFVSGNWFLGSALPTKSWRHMLRMKRESGANPEQSPLL